jgi:hypothetical protein
LDTQSNILSQLKPHYFWDIDITKLNDRAAKRLIIDRVFSLGNLQEINLIVNHYGRKKVIEVICKLNYLDPKTFNFTVKLFNLPKNAFVCHTRKQLKPQHWNS